MRTVLQNKMIAHHYILLMLFLFFSFTNLKGQAPVNNDCGGAIDLAVDHPYVNGNVSGATQSMPACDGSANDDVWYKFQPSSNYMIVAVQSSAQFDAVLQVFSGSCGNLQSINCSDETKAGGIEKIAVNHFTPGQTYYLRVYDWTAGIAPTKDFQIRIYTPSRPSNDECAHAIAMPVRDHCQSTTQTMEGATGSGVTPSCASGTANNDDTWFSFVPITNQVILRTHASHNYRAVLEAFDDCGGVALPQGCTTSTKHNKAVKLQFDNLTPNKKYYFRVYNYYQELSKTETFELCVYDPPIPPNDECANAININPQQTLGGTVDGATPSAGYPAPCSGSPDDDVWYKFSAESPNETFQLIPSPYFDGAMQVFDACHGQVVACVNAGDRNKMETLNLTGLSVGHDYFIRVFTSENVVSVTPEFQIVRTTHATPLANDDCDKAINIPIIQNGGTANGKLDNATQSLPSCNDTLEANDAWFKFTASRTNNIEVVPKDSNDLVFSILDGCNGNEVACVNDRGEGGTEHWDKPLLTEDQTYYIRVYDNEGSNHNANFAVNISTTGVQAVKTKFTDEFKAFPLPVRDVLYLDIKNAKTGNLILTDMQGNILLRDQGTLKNNYDVSELSSGIYYLKIISEENTYIIKVIKQ